jgi:hypothetical protein
VRRRGELAPSGHCLLNNVHEVFLKGWLYGKLVKDRSRSPDFIESTVVDGTTVIAASQAKAKFSELLERARKGEGFAITCMAKRSLNWFRPKDLV